MANYALTENKIMRWIKEGRGLGSLKTYKPWFKVRDVPSNGFSTRIKGLRTQRVHHLLSYLELWAFLIFEWYGALDIREQYPLLPFKKTVAISNKYGLTHPLVIGTNIPFVMTTDFLVTFQIDGKKREFPFAIKYKNDLGNRLTLEKLEIERLFWVENGLEWKIFTEYGGIDIFAKNIMFFRNYYDISKRLYLPETDCNQIKIKLFNLLQKENLPLRRITKDCDGLLGLKKGSSMTVFHNSVAHHRISVDMHKPFKPVLSVKELGMVING